MTQFLHNLAKFTKEEIDAFLGTFDTILTDGDGVLWFLHESIPGSIEAINRLKALGKKVFLVSNNCTLTLDDYVTKVKSYKLNLEKDEIIIPTSVSVDYLKEHDFKKKAFILGTKAFIKDMESNGIKRSNDVGPDHALEDYLSFKIELENIDKDVGAVIVDFDYNINYMKMMKALQHLKKPDCHFIVGGTDVQSPIAKNFKIIGPGGFISLLETVSGRKAVVTGKPSEIIKEFIAKRHPINPERTLMIGDMLETDMKLGTNCGFQKLLVLSGIATLEDANKEDSSNLPHYYIRSLEDLLPLLPTS